MKTAEVPAAICPRIISRQSGACLIPHIPSQLCGRRCKSIIQNLLTFSRSDNSEQEQLSINSVGESALSLVQY
jgi:hypothetical protein